MELTRQPDFNAQILQRACEWFVEFRTEPAEPDEAMRRAFHDWLQQSPQHMGAYLQLAALWNESIAVDRQEKWTVETLIAQARADVGNVVPLAAAEECAVSSATLAARQGTPRRRYFAQRRHWFAAAAVLLAAAGLSTWLLVQRHSYSTGIGEQRFIALPDGSTVNLNSRSRIRVRYSARERLVQLQAGQALFEVAKSAARPFVVISGETRVRAIGTRFDVYRRSDDTTVTVIEGRIAVMTAQPQAHAPRSEAMSDAAAIESDAHTIGPAARLQPAELALRQTRNSAEVLLEAGQQLRVGADLIPRRPVSADLTRVTAWTQRQLVFDSTPLAQVAEEFNRYNERQLVIANAALNDFQIDGVFSSTDPAPLIRFLQARPEIRIAESRGEIIISAP